MSLVPPRQGLSSGPRDSGEDILQHEVFQERAHTLGTLGKRAEDALQALRDHDAGGGSQDENVREALLDAAAEAVWHFKIQRELCGLRDWKEVVKDLRIPGAVSVRLGAQVRRPAPADRKPLR